MPQTYYIDGSTLLNSTAVYTDAGLTTCAPDGFYSDGINSRELVGCILLPAQACGSCATPCGQPIAANGGQGIYKVDLDAGNSIGAMIVRYNPASIPDGIRILYNGGVYNQLSSPVDGYHASTDPNGYTYIGATTADCGISGTTYPALVEYVYNGASFVASGNTVSVFVAAGDVSLGAAPGNCVMVIPKISATPSLIQVEAVGPCSGTAWSLNIACTVALTGYSSTTRQPACTEACGLPLTQTYYNAPVTGTTGSPALYDWVFSDANGQFILTDGYYGITGAKCMTVQNGIIVAISDCDIPPAPCEVSVYSHNVVVCQSGDIRCTKTTGYINVNGNNVYSWGTAATTTTGSFQVDPGDIVEVSVNAIQPPATCVNNGIFYSDVEYTINGPGVSYSAGGPSPYTDTYTFTATGCLYNIEILSACS